MLGRLFLIVVEARAPWRGSVVVEVAGRHVVRVAVVLRRALPTGVGLVLKALEFDKPTGVPAPVNIFKLHQPPDSKPRLVAPFSKHALVAVD